MQDGKYSIPGSMWAKGRSGFSGPYFLDMLGFYIYLLVMVALFR